MTTRRPIVIGLSQTTGTFPRMGMNDKRTAPRLSRSRRLLDHIPEMAGADSEAFGCFSEETLTTITSLRLPRETWVDFGRPGRLTVTIEPGDQLDVGVTRRRCGGCGGAIELVHGAESAWWAHVGPYTDEHETRPAE